MKTNGYPDAPGDSAFPVAKAGIPYIIALAFATLILALLELAIPAILLLAATAFVCFFFRDPERIAPETEGCVVSAADGKVIKAGRVESNRYIDGPTQRVSVFMSVFNVHVNRNPVSGKVVDVLYNPGKFFRADLDKASVHNEQNAVFVELEDGSMVCVVQVAGLVARRIMSGLKPGDETRRGERFGMIRFGSRLDVYLPENAEITVKPGDMVRAGTSVVGKMP
ncbi:MAG: phosphatidylserine decarboxylase family protein [Desulfatibacillaceae bacterium]